MTGYGEIVELNMQAEAAYQRELAEHNRGRHERIRAAILDHITANPTATDADLEHVGQAAGAEHDRGAP